MKDEVNSPSHYKLFPDMEAIDVIEKALTPEEFNGYCKGNALKYRLRAGEKGPAEKCIAKSKWYQDRLSGKRPEASTCKDPRQVFGVDDAFPTERGLNITPRYCADCSSEHCPCVAR